MLKVIIAEDNDIVRNKIVKEVSKFKEIEIAYSTDDGEEFLKSLYKVKPDIIIADISMPKMTGIEAVKEVREKIPNAEVVFITSFDNYLKEAFELYACDYIQKPLDIIRLHHTLERIINKLITTMKFIEFKDENGEHFVKENDLIMIESNKRKCTVYTVKGSFEIIQSLKEAESILSKDRFYKTSRFNIINLQQVKAIKKHNRTSYLIEFINSNCVATLSKDKYGEFREVFKRYINQGDS